MITRFAALALVAGGLAACTTPDPLNTAGRPDGTPGNPRGTEVTRANDRIGDPLNIQGRPDGTPGNPPGTAVSRTLGTTDPEPAARPTRRTRRAAAATPRRATPAAVRASGRSTAGSPDFDTRTPNSPGQQSSGQQP